MTFRQALVESILETIVGRHQLQMWHKEDANRKEAEALCQRYLDEVAGRVMREDEYKIEYYPANK